MFDVSAVDQVLLLAKNARGLSSVIDLVKDALTRTDLFVFGELRELPIIQQLKGEAEFRPWYSVLELFCYGVWKDYAGERQSFPQLSLGQMTKLKQLTVVTMAQSKQVLLYSELKEAIDVTETRDLEDFLINNCFYCRILKGKLNQARELLMVEDSIDRDMHIQDFPQIKNKLRTWFQSSETCLEDILGRIIFTKEAVEKNEMKKRQLTAETEEKMKEIKDLDGLRMDTSDLVTSIFAVTDDERESKSRRSAGGSNF